MKGQYSIEVMLIVAAFFAVMAAFIGIYAGFIGEEHNLGATAKLSLEINRIKNSVNHVYVMGPGNRIELNVSLDSYVLEAEENRILMGFGGQNESREVFTRVEGGAENSSLLIVKNEGGIIKIEGSG